MAVRVILLNCAHTPIFYTTLAIFSYKWKLDTFVFHTGANRSHEMLAIF